MPGQASGPQQFADQSAQALDTSNGTTAVSGNTIAQYQQAAQQAYSTLGTFFGTGAGYAPQFEPQYQPGLAVQQETAAANSATPASSAASGSVT